VEGLVVMFRKVDRERLERIDKNLVSFALAIAAKPSDIQKNVLQLWHESRKANQEWAERIEQGLNLLLQSHAALEGQIKGLGDGLAEQLRGIHNNLAGLALIEAHKKGFKIRQPKQRRKLREQQQKCTD
jgi:hypothetical protein